MGDFLGFTFGDDHSSSLGITRVSGGDRYEEQLHPEIKDRTAEVPGLNGEYYFGSDFGPRPFDIEIAFDHLTEEQFRKLRTIFGTKQIKKLIFDERPYKYYMAKLESPIELSYVCFDEPLKVETTIEGIPYKEGEDTLTSHIVMRSHEQGKTQRIYKGEGKITFIAHFPFAKSVYKQLPTDEEESGWAVSSGILSAEEYSPTEIDIQHQPYDSYIIPLNEDIPYINIYNAGDIATGFRLYIPFVGTEKQIQLTYQAKKNLVDFDILQFTLPAVGREFGIHENNYDVGVLVDTNNCLIMGVSQFANDGYTTSGNIYNDCIDSGYFFKLQPNEKSDEAKLKIMNGNEGIRILYDYLYF